MTYNQEYEDEVVQDYVDQDEPDDEESTDRTWTQQKHEEAATEFGELIKEKLTDHQPGQASVDQSPDEGMQITIELITPQIAAQLLEINTRNRPLNKQHVLFLAEQMTKDAWQIAGDPIRISKTGSLLDGQHRAAAIVESGKTQKMVVIRNLPDETFHVMDTGRNRKAADVVAIEGHANAKYVGSVARMIINFRRGTMSNTLQNMGRKAGISVTNTDIITFLSTTDLQPAIQLARKWYTECRLFTASEYAFFYFIFNELSPDDAVEFLGSLASGADLSKGSPIFVLRKKIESYRLNRISISGTEKLAYIIKAWNFFRTKKECGYLTWKRESEDFPTAI